MVCDLGTVVGVCRGICGVCHGRRKVQSCVCEARDIAHVWVCSRLYCLWAEVDTCWCQ